MNDPKIAVFQAKDLRGNRYEITAAACLPEGESPDSDLEPWRGYLQFTTRYNGEPERFVERVDRLLFQIEGTEILLFPESPPSERPMVRRPPILRNRLTQARRPGRI